MWLSELPTSGPALCSVMHNYAVRHFTCCKLENQNTLNGRETAIILQKFNIYTAYQEARLEAISMIIQCLLYRFDDTSVGRL